MVWLAVILLGLTLLAGLEVLVGSARIARLIDLPPLDSAVPPRVSIVVAARNEARGIGPAVLSMLAQRYPDCEVVVVDDRSDDGTGAILATLAAGHANLRIIRVDDLPSGWLGKNHALQTGAEAASGDWLLFTDADIHLEPEALSRAVRYATEQGVDHLVVAPELELPGLLLKAFGVFFLFAFLSFSKPWRARDPKSRFFVGVGAFNLVRASAYHAVDGHRRIRLRPDDDMKLGKILKRSGFRQDALSGDRALRVEWYHSLGEMIRGFEKNMFSGVEYSVLLSLLGGVSQLALALLPLLLLLPAAGAARALFGAQILSSLLLFALLARRSRTTLAVVPLYPVVVLLFVFILWRTMVLNLVQGGIRWRDTFYPLRDLKANRV